ncbi:MAG: flavodoxin family protein [Candidatus Omnitrophica bacterium]|nr:flavodoxin family protein [Candidatus Omnitrophota bacterium]
MKILGISGSPRRRGNTEILLDDALEGARSEGAFTKKLILNELNIKPCQACGGCDDTGRCVIRDDMDIVYKEAHSADCVILASPLYFGSVSAQTKAVIDRFQCEWVRRNILRSADEKLKVGAFICVSGANRPKLFSDARKIVRIFFKSIGIEYRGELFCAGADAKGLVKRNAGARYKALRLGISLAKG